MSETKKSLPVVNGKITTAPGGTIEGVDTNRDGVVDTVIMRGVEPGVNIRFEFANNGHSELYIRDRDGVSTAKLDHGKLAATVVAAWNKAVKGDNSIDPNELGTLTYSMQQAAMETASKGKRTGSIK